MVATKLGPTATTRAAVPLALLLQQRTTTNQLLVAPRLDRVEALPQEITTANQAEALHLVITVATVNRNPTTLYVRTSVILNAACVRNALVANVRMHANTLLAMMETLVLRTTIVGAESASLELPSIVLSVNHVTSLMAALPTTRLPATLKMTNAQRAISVKMESANLVQRKTVAASASNATLRPENVSGMTESPAMEVTFV
jgi:hypothetical protein